MKTFITMCCHRNSTTPRISGNFEVQPVVSAKDSEVIACKQADISRGLCTAADFNVRHNSVIRFEVLAKDVDDLDIPADLLASTKAPTLWRCPPWKMSTTNEGPIDLVKDGECRKNAFLVSQ